MQVHQPCVTSSHEQKVGVIRGGSVCCFRNGANTSETVRKKKGATRGALLPSSISGGSPLGPASQLGGSRHEPATREQEAEPEAKLRVGPG